MNRYSPYFDPDTGSTIMSIDESGSWVHVTQADSIAQQLDDEQRAHSETRAKLEEAEARLQDALIPQEQAVLDAMAEIPTPELRGFIAVNAHIKDLPLYKACVSELARREAAK